MAHDIRMEQNFCARWKHCYLTTRHNEYKRLIRVDAVRYRYRSHTTPMKRLNRSALRRRKSQQNLTRVEEVSCSFRGDFCSLLWTLINCKKFAVRSSFCCFFALITRQSAWMLCHHDGWICRFTWVRNSWRTKPCKCCRCSPIDGRRYLAT